MKRYEKVGEALGTGIRLVCVSSERSAEEGLLLAWEECGRIEAAYSRFIGNNELARLNGLQGEWVEVSSELYALLSFGVDLFEKSGGAFNLTVGSILEGWGYDADYLFNEKSPGCLGQIELDSGLVRVSASVDLGGLGKGYALDRMSTCLEAFENVLIDAGGDLVARGVDETGRPWRVAFEHPTDPSKAIGVVEVTEPLALASSSPSRRAWKGKHHLVNPQTGQPASDMLAVYTQAATALEADAWATALFVSGFEKAQSLLKKSFVESLLVRPSGELFRTKGFRGELFTC